MIELVVLATIVAVMAAVSTTVGPAGGVVFASMAVLLPAPAVVPVHAAIQTGGSLMRSVALWRFVDARAAAAFIASGTVGAAVAGLVVSDLSLDADWLRLGLGAATLGPALVSVGSGRSDRPRASSLIGLGAITSFLAVFVGATGALVGSVLGRGYRDQRRRVATHASCLCFQHLSKIAVYGAIGFSFAQYLPLIGVLLAASAGGTVVGRRVLAGADNHSLRAVFELLVVALGVFLVVTAGLALWHRN